jgi:hypothetical protein
LFFFSKNIIILKNHTEETMKNRVFTLTLLLMIAVTGVWAQNLPGNIWSSPQSTTTEGRYRSNADDFIRPDAYTNVNFNKWFGMVAFISNYGDSDTDAIATAGFATKINDLYIGAFYGGNFWTGSPTNNFTERKITGNTFPDNTYNIYNTPNVEPGPVNNAAILIGIADMGFRLTYRTNHQLFNKSDFVIGNETSGYQLYRNYQAESGYIAPQIAWGRAKD